ncbi:hypothetical protein LTR56_021502 [Elasticomyces elasticus]|nr:hypothetical protein LTR56_021502 [Elasticomyces elasticus]KAK3660495.1 hypothetical protein LTR22_007936 [Elasticomyces elasticus]KAK4923892.1 hypothetical protein LTR49_009040 [Elasticomyces elasticus]KAK5754846.1 hypothetical protein LTS12_015062 [Elasticomyces elasticus]
MRTSALATGALAILLPATLAQSTTAPEVTGNPGGAQYIATLPNNGSLPNGNVVVSSMPDGNGVDVQISINNLPSSGGPFLYHIHVNPVDSTGNCTTTGAHLDPYNVTEAVTCNASKPEDCQVGDLSGKHYKINGTSLTANYIDKYISTQPGTPAFMGNRSIVIHFANKTRITCANFTIPGQYSPGASGNGVSSVVTPVAGPTGQAGQTPSANGAGSLNPSTVSATTVLTDKPPAAATTVYTDKPPATSNQPAPVVLAPPAPAGPAPGTTTTISYPGVVPNYTPGLNDAQPPTVTVAIVVQSAPPGTNVIATVTQTVPGTITYANPATSTLPAGVSAVTTLVTVLVGPGPSSHGSTITTTISGQPSGQPSSKTVTQKPLGPSQISKTTTTISAHPTPTATLEVLAVPATTVRDTSTGKVPTQVKITRTIVSTSTGYVTTVATFSAAAPGSTWTTTMSQNTTLGWIGKVTSWVMGSHTQTTTLPQTPTTIALLGVASKFTTTLPLGPGATSITTLLPQLSTLTSTLPNGVTSLLTTTLPLLPGATSITTILPELTTLTTTLPDGITSLLTIETTPSIDTDLLPTASTTTILPGATDAPTHAPTSVAPTDAPTDVPTSDAPVPATPPANPDTPPPSDGSAFQRRPSMFEIAMGVVAGLGMML